MSAAPSKTEGVAYRPGIDGLRALAVIAVLLYHADISWLPAGFLGVDVFFAISGYLICSLLVAEWDATGRIALRRFWMRRARRLLPAVGALLVGVTVIAALDAPDAIARLRGDVPAAAGYVSNWWQIVRGQSYFETFGRPPLLRHLWSLAVEEQFYAAFPVMLFAGLRVCRRHRRLIALVAVLTGAASTLLMAWLWQPNRDPTRVYYGTDTRAVCLCAGVALAFVWSPLRMRSALPAVRRLLLDGAGVLGVVALAALMMRLNDYGSSLYHGGFAATAAASCIVLAAVAHPASRLGALLGRQPLRWIGTRSYAIYLWHWPVFAVTRPHLDVGLTGWRVLVLRLAITAALAEVSWRVVEQPFRTGAVRRWWRATGARVRWQTAMVTVAAGGLVATVLVAAHAGPPSRVLASGAPARSGTTALLEIPKLPAPPPPPAAVEELPVVTNTATTTTTATTITSTTTVMATTAAAPKAPPRPTPRPAGMVTTAKVAPPPPPAPRPPPGPPQGSVLAIGDSVMVGAKAALTSQSQGRIFVDAAIGRQVSDGLDLLQRYRDRGDLANVVAVVIHLGTNGPFTGAQFDRLAALVEGVPRVVVLNVRVPKRWEGQSNSTIGNGVPKHPAMRLGNWHDASAAKGVVGDDGVHPSPAGAKVYANLVLEQLQASPPPPPATTTTAPPTTTTTTPSTTAPPPSTTTSTEPPTTTSSSTTSTTSTTVSPAPTSPAGR